MLKNSGKLSKGERLTGGGCSYCYHCGWLMLRSSDRLYMQYYKSQTRIGEILRILNYGKHMLAEVVGVGSLKFWKSKIWGPGQYNLNV